MLRDVKLLAGWVEPQAFSRADAVAKFEYCGLNTGNLWFLDALKLHIPHAEPVYSWQDAVSGQCAVFSMANFVNPHTDVSNEVSLFESSNVERIVIAGCGAQARHIEEDFPLRPDTKKFLSIVGERSKSIGVRGEYTADLLYRNGYKNIRIIGCPAFYHNGSVPPVLRIPARLDRIGINTTPSGDDQKKIQELLGFGMRNNASYILQGEDLLLALFIPEPNSKQLNDLKFFKHFYCPPETAVDDFEKWIRDKSVIFYDLNQWLDFTRDLDFVIGTRIHGSWAAVRGGCPALTVVIDTRTRELCEHFDFPFIPLEEFDPTKDPLYYFEKADFRGFHANYHNRRAEYLTFLEENELIEGPRGN
jgi:hypothetical protein